MRYFHDDQNKHLALKEKMQKMVETWASEVLIPSILDKAP